MAGGFRPIANSEGRHDLDARAAGLVFVVDFTAPPARQSS
jgi:hypothetical protein